MPISIAVPQSDINRTIGSPLNFPAAPGVGALGRAAGLTATISSGTTALTVSGVALTSDHEGKMVLVEKAGGIGSGAVVWAVNTTAGNNTIELVSGTASVGDVNKRITINMAGTDTITEPATITGFIDATHVTVSPAPGTAIAGAHSVVGDNDPRPLITTIVSVTDATHCVVTDAASSSVTGTACAIGVEETDAVALAALSLGHLFVPDDKAFIVRGPINVSNRKLRIWGGGKLYFIDDGIVATNCNVSIDGTTLDGTFLPYTQQPLRYIDISGTGRLSCGNATFIAPKREADDQPTDEAQYWEGVAVFARGSTTSFAPNITFERCQIFSGQNGIVLDYCSHIKITTCEFYTQSEKALTHILAATCQHYTIPGNTFHANGQIANAVYNRMSSFMGDHSIGPRFISISNNTITGHFDYEAILLFTASNCSVVGNTIEYVHTYNNSTGIASYNLSLGIEAGFIVIEANTITMPDAVAGGGVYGINCSALVDGVIMRNVTIAKNIIQTPGHGIVVSRNIDCELASNNITITGGIAGKDGILLIFGSGLKINGGSIKGASAHGININTTTFGISHVNISNCAANGIFLPATYGVDSFIYECRLNDNAAYGIACQSTELGLHIERNKYAGNTLGECVGYSDSASLTGNYENNFRTNRAIGVGVNPQAPTHIYSPTGHVWMRAEGNDFHEVSLETAGAGGSATASIISGKAARGSITAKTASASGDETVRVEGRGYDGSAYQLASMISQLVGGTVSAGVVPGRIDFYVANLLGSLQRVLRMDDTVSLLLGTTNNCRIIWGTSFPAADSGSILLRTNGAGSTSLYSRAGSNWEAVLSVASGFVSGPVRFSGTNLYNPTASELRTDADVYSKAEVDALVVDPSDYYTKGQIDTMMAGKANVSHSHTFTGSALPTHTHTETGTTTGATSGGTPAGTVT